MLADANSNYCSRHSPTRRMFGKSAKKKGGKKKASKKR
jgi:hypothetical protein